MRPIRYQLSRDNADRLNRMEGLPRYADLRAIMPAGRAAGGSIAKGDDPYFDVAHSLLRNRAELTAQDDLDHFEARGYFERVTSAWPPLRLDAPSLLALHRHCFQDVYSWAGQLRSVRISKNDTIFCLPEYLTDQLSVCFDHLRDIDYLRGRSADDFAAGAAAFLADLNAIHPFREGNGRTQHAFLAMLADFAGHPLTYPEDDLDLQHFKWTVINSFSGDLGPLTRAIRECLPTPAP